MTQNMESHQQIREILAFLKILALGTRQIEQGKVEPASEVVARLRLGRTTP